MKKLLFVCLSLFVLAVALPALAADPEAPADGLKMERTKKPVVFNHSTHKANKCVDCHHQVDGKESYAKCGSAGCHDIMDKKDKSSKGYYHIIHQKKDLKFQGCLNCHTTVATSDAVKSDAAKVKELIGCGKGSKCHVQAAQAQ